MSDFDTATPRPYIRPSSTTPSYGGRVQPSPYAVVECAEFVLVVGVVETEHRLDVIDGLETSGHATADPAGGRIRRDEIGVFRLDPLELAHQRVEFGVGDFGRSEDVVPLFVVPNQAAKFCDAFSRVHRSRAMT